jgi:hypothetical protein
VADEWGPLGPLAGEWEGDGGLDSAYSHAQGAVVGTPYREHLSLKPFGPVRNGRQELFGLDYRTAMWRGDDENPFHTEVGYWLWDATAGEIVRGFVVPRGITVLAGGSATADARSFTLSATAGDPRFTIGETTYLSEAASTSSYTVTVTIGDDGTWSYDERTTVHLSELPEPLAHTDRNTLHRVG